MRDIKITPQDVAELEKIINPTLEAMDAALKIPLADTMADVWTAGQGMVSAGNAMMEAGTKLQRYALEQSHRRGGGANGN